MSNNTYISLTDDAEPPQWFCIEALESFLKKVFAACHYSNWELSVLFCRNEFIRNLNRQYRGKDEATDVLSFSQTESSEADIPSFPAEVQTNKSEKNESLFVAGDILISFDYIKQNAADFGVDEKEELQRLLIHGILHLAGYDHQTNDPNEKMLLLQEKILQEVNR